MRASQRGRFLVRLRKIAWLLPIAMLAGVQFVFGMDIPDAIKSYVPGLGTVPDSVIEDIALSGWVLIAFICSAQVTRRFAKTRLVPEPFRQVAGNILGVISFFGYFLAAHLIGLLADYIHVSISH